RVGDPVPARWRSAVLFFRAIGARVAAMTPLVHSKISFCHASDADAAGSPLLRLTVSLLPDYPRLIWFKMRLRERIVRGSCSSGQPEPSQMSTCSSFDNFL